MKLGGNKFNLKSSSALVVAAGCTVAFMFIVTSISLVVYQKQMDEANKLLQETKYDQYDSYVAMIVADGETDFWQKVYQSAYEYGKENGIYVDLMSDNVDTDYSKDELLEMAINADCDGILLEGDQSEETAQLLNRAAAASIPVITMDSDVAKDQRISFVGVNAYTVANLYADSLLDNLVKQKHVLVLGDSSIDESQTSTFVTNISENLSGADIKNAPLEFEVRLVESDDAFATEEFVQNIFKKNEVKPIVICLDANTTECFYQAMIDYNMVGQVLLLGNYETPAIYTGIKQGVIKSTVSMDAEKMGISAVDAFSEYRDLGYVSDYINVEPKLIDASNIDSYIEEVADEQGQD